MLKLLAALAFAASVVVILTQTDLVKIDTSEFDARAERRIAGTAIFYFIDPRTNICYSTNNVNTVHEVRTSVQCTDLVMKAIQEDREFLVK